MAISNFKTHALKIIVQISKSRENLIITKRGKPIAQLIPFNDSKNKPVPGKLAATFIYEKDIVSPLGEEIWDVSK